MAKATVFLAITSAVAIAGKIAAPGDIVEVDEDLAVNLLQRGKAELATADAATAAALDDADDADAGEDTSEDAGEDNKAPAKPADAKPAKPAK